MAGKLITWDDFSGGYFVGPRENQQPMNTWRGTDVTVAPQSGYLVRRARYVLSSSGTFSAGSAPSSWPSTIRPSAPVMFEMSDSSNVVSAYAFSTIGGTPGAPSNQFVVLRGGLSTSVNTVANFGLPALKTATTNPIVVPVGTQANVFTAVAKPDGTNPELLMIDTGTATMTNVTIPQPFGQIELFGDYMVAASLSSNRLYFSNVYPTYSNWTTAGLGGFFEVGDGSPIFALVPQRDSLWIGKRNGWWVLTGVLESADAVSLRQVAVTNGPPGVNPGVSVSGFPYPFRHAGLRDLAVATDLGIAYPNGVVSSQSIGSFQDAPGPGGRGGMSVLAGIDTRLVLACPEELMQRSGSYYGLTSCADSTVVVEHSGGGVSLTDPIPRDEFVTGLWVLKGKVWERRTAPTEMASIGGLGSWCRDMRAHDSTPRQNIVLALRSIDGSTEDFRAYSGALYNEYPDDAAPVSVKLASHYQPQSFKPKRLHILVDYGRLYDFQDALGNNEIPVPFVRARLASPGAVHNGLGAEYTDWQQLDIEAPVGAFYQRQTAMLSFETTNLSETMEVWPELVFSGCRIVRVTLEVA